MGSRRRSTRGHRGHGQRRSSGGTGLALVALLITALVTFVQNVIDYLQSMSAGAYQPFWQRVLIMAVLLLSLIGLAAAYAGSRDGLRRR